MTVIKKRIDRLIKDEQLNVFKTKWVCEKCASFMIDNCIYSMYPDIYNGLDSSKSGQYDNSLEFENLPKNLPENFYNFYFKKIRYFIDNSNTKTPYFPYYGGTKFDERKQLIPDLTLKYQRKFMSIQTKFIMII